MKGINSISSTNHARTPAEESAMLQRQRREAKRKDYLIRKSRTRDRWADDYGMYVLVGDSRGNRLPGAAAAPNAFRRGEGDTVDGIAEELRHLPG
jgi:hypothetical protein